MPVASSHSGRVAGLDIRIDRVGAGKPAVFLNGLFGQNEHWFPLLAPIAANNECVLIQSPLMEMRGKGSTIEGQTNLTISLLETLLDEPVVLLGNSFGGHVALRIAIQRPDLVRGMVLIGSAGLFEKTLESGVKRYVTREWLKEKIGELFYDKSHVRPEYIEHPYQILKHRSCARAFISLGRSVRADHLGEKLHLVDCPTQLVWGDKDIVTPPSVAREFHENIANSRLEWIENCGHAPQLERPLDLSHRIVGFLKDLDDIDAKAVPGVA